MSSNLHGEGKTYAGGWTDEQRQAIVGRGKNMLVSAGAGSGKTRVLVERVLQRITGSPPTGVDRLLVVTFTNAAAAEMKQRLGSSLEKAVQKEPHSAHLRRQLLLLDNASISTVHSFCMDVIKRYHYLRDLNPSFRVMDENEARLLRGDVLEDLLDQLYEQHREGSPFYRLVDACSSSRGDAGLQELIQRVYTFSRSHPWTDDWLERAARFFNIEGNYFSADAGEWVKVLLQDCRVRLEGILERLLEGLRLAREPGGPRPYVQNLEEEAARVESALKASYLSWEQLHNSLGAVFFGRLKSCRNDTVDPVLKEQVARFREECKKELAAIKEELFGRSLREQSAEIGRLAPLTSALVDAVKAFSARYRSAKAEKGVVDFSDLEHHALALLTEESSTPHNIIPSAAALEYRHYFQEVMVDEYQDINEVQDTILGLVSRPEPGGNMFMVGDIRQSIYRFRLAEPELFLQRRIHYSSCNTDGECISLARNFRSRKEILAAVNYIFSQIMDQNVGEINYESADRLLYGASYPPPSEKGPAGPGVDVFLISGSRSDSGPGEHDEEDNDNGTVMADGETAEGEGTAAVEWERAALEGRLIGQQIKKMTGGEGGSPSLIYDRKENRNRPLKFSDIVVLLRSAQNWAPSILEQLRLVGIPAYAELERGYFEATEVEVMLALLKIIDNPYQDVPLAAVLRSPVVGLTAEDLARIRVTAPGRHFYDTLVAYGSRCGPLPETVRDFLDKLQRWQDTARQGSLTELVRQLYSETGYYDLVGGMPAGQQRQANLRALYDRARSYELTSFRGLFRFLRFVEKLQEEGGDLGAGRAIGEGEDAVRVVTVHKSKGLEFPVVFVAGLSKQFNMQDLRRSFLLHKDLGFGFKQVDTTLNLAYPTLPWLAVRQRLKLELLAEEMRILYVALTRAEERLFLVASLKELSGAVGRWAQAARAGGQLLPAHYRSRARSWLDWVGPALLRHPDAAVLHRLGGLEGTVPVFAGDDSAWRISIVSTGEIISRETAPGHRGDSKSEDRAEKCLRLKGTRPVPVEAAWTEQIEKQLSWSYRWHPATVHFAKISVSELNKRILAGQEAGSAGEAPWLQEGVLLRPRFLEKEKLSSVQRGAVYHKAMQYLDLERAQSEGEVQRQLQEMAVQQKLSGEEVEELDPRVICDFMDSSLGRRMRSSMRVLREVPFSMALPAEEVYPQWMGGPAAGGEGFSNREAVLVQGVIDCLFREKDGLVVIDYKSGDPTAESEEALKERYHLQLNLYSLALERIWEENVKEKYLYFLEGRRTVQL